MGIFKGKASVDFPGPFGQMSGANPGLMDIVSKLCAKKFS